MPSAPTAVLVTATPLVGRQREIDQLCGLLRGGRARLVTLTGDGGCGKTRLAMQVLSETRNDVADGVRSIALADVSDPQLLPAAIASPLGVVERPPQSTLDAVADFLSPRHLLLLVDNCQRAVSVKPRFALDATNRPAVISICAA